MRDFRRHIASIFLKSGNSYEIQRRAVTLRTAGATTGTFPEKVARRCTKPMIMVKAKGPMSTFLSRWF